MREELSEAHVGRRAAYAGAVLIGLNYAITANYEIADPFHLAALVAGALALLAIVRGWRLAGVAALVYVVIIGLHIHLGMPLNKGSDVLRVTDEAVNLLGAGQNPYSHYFFSSVPPGAPFRYFPGEIVFYDIWKALFGTVLTADRIAGAAIVLLFAAFAPLVGLEIAAITTALYGTSALVVWRATDGSNDTTLALLIILALWTLAAAQRLRADSRLGRYLFAASAILFGWALAFKLFAFFIFPYVIAYLRLAGWPWRRYLAYGAGTFLILTLPFFIWDPGGFARHTVLSQFYHQDIWGLNVWTVIRLVWPQGADLIAPGISFIQAAAVLYMFALTWRHAPRTLGRAVLGGCAVLLISFLFANWTSSAYYSFLAAIVATGAILALGRPQPADNVAEPVAPSTPP